MALIKEAMMLSFKMYQEAGEEIPEPISKKNFAGNIAHPTTSERHYLIAREARKRNMSLSQIIDTFIDTAKANVLLCLDLHPKILQFKNHLVQSSNNRSATNAN